LIDSVNELTKVRYRRIFPHGATVPSGPRPLHYRCFMTTLGLTPLDGWSARRRDLNLTAHNTHRRHPWHWWDLNR